MVSLVHKLTWILVAAIILAGASWWLYRYTENERRIRDLEREKQQLQAMVQRLTSQTRVAEMMLLERSTEEGHPAMQVLFVEYARDGEVAANVRRFSLKGREVHVDAKVIRFERDFLYENDPLRGTSVALFTKIYGNLTSPENGAPIDPEGAAPEVYRGANPEAAEFEARLWKDFWRLLEDEAYAKEHGVRVAQGEGVWWPPQEGKLYTLSIAADGGLELKSEPVKAIYLEAMRKLAPTTTTAPTTLPHDRQ